MNKKLTYGELLSLPEWKDKRKEILSRDKFVCQKCKNEQYYKTCFKGIFINFFDNSGAPIFFINHQASFFLTRNLASNLGIRKNSVVFFKENEDRLYIYASRLLSQSEIEVILEWTDKKSQNFKETSEEKNDYESPFINNDISDWTFVRDLHVHHTYYQRNLKPWEYPTDSLQTLCWSCHSDIHATTDIPVIDENSNLIGYFDPCSRCSGAGYIPIYKHVQNGVCFYCSGGGYLSSDFIRKTKKY